MHSSNEIGKREFIQHTSKYLQWVEKDGQPLVITHHNKPDLILMKIRPKTFDDLKGLTSIKVVGDINEPTLTDYDSW